MGLLSRLTAHVSPFQANRIHDRGKAAASFGIPAAVPGVGYQEVIMSSHTRPSGSREFFEQDRGIYAIDLSLRSMTETRFR